MEETYQKLVWMGISLLVLAVIIGMISASLLQSYKYNDKIIENQAMALEMAEQRKNIFYNNTHVYQQDVVDYIFRYKGDRAVTVRYVDASGKTVTLEWSKDKKSSDYTISNVSGKIPQAYIYDSYLNYLPGTSQIIGVDFIACPSNTGQPGALCPLGHGGP